MKSKPTIMDQPIPYSLTQPAPAPYRMVVAPIYNGLKPFERECRFHCFSTSYEEFDDCEVPYPVAIIEGPDGKIYTPSADSIRFTTGLMDTDTKSKEI